MHQGMLTHIIAVHPCMHGSLTPPPPPLPPTASSCQHERQVPTLASAALSILRGCVAPFMLTRSGDASLTHRRVLLNNVDGVLRPVSDRGER